MGEHTLLEEASDELASMHQLAFLFRYSRLAIVSVVMGVRLVQEASRRSRRRSHCHGSYLLVGLTKLFFDVLLGPGCEGGEGRTRDRLVVSYPSCDVGAWRGR
jgi:hypothetical protein